MENYTGRKYPQGDFIDTFGNTVGKHNGAVRYTIGQRKGLGIAAETPLYVLRKNMTENTVYVGTEDHLYSTALFASDMNWISISELKEPLRCKAKTRYRQQEQWAIVYPYGSERIKLVFDEPQRAVTVGQAVVLYDGDFVIGGGTIISVGSEGSESHG